MEKSITIIILILLWTTGVYAQNKISGTVLDFEGEPVTGATILEKGTKNFALTDLDGRFEIAIQGKLPAALQINAVGSKQEEIEIYEIDEEPLIINLKLDLVLEGVTVTARRRSETAQEVPIPVSIVRGAAIEDAGVFNVNRVKELVPSVQLYSSNPRNTTLNIRGLGSTFGLTNDGIDPGVGFYVDGVYYARPAATTLDFIDIDQLEVLRGPQGTLFGKNTTAGAFNITTRAPSFTPGAVLEVSYGNYGFIQAKTSITGGLGKKFAGRLSFSGTQRNGLIYNERTNEKVNDLNNLGVRGQLLFKPSEKFKVTLIGDATTQNPNGYAQVVAGVAPTQRAAYRQFEQIINDLNYDLPTRDPFERRIDHNTPWRSGNDLGGISLNIDATIGEGILTSTTAWRYWKWGPSNDRDFTGLEALSLSQAPSKHNQWSQEIRYAGDISSKLSAVVGVFILGQELNTNPYHSEESGKHQWRFVQSSTSDLWQTPGLLDGYGIRTVSKLTSLSSAFFGQLDWAITSKLHLLPGIRYNSDKKEVDFDRRTYGGLDTDDPALIAIKQSVYSDQTFKADADEGNWSGQVTLTYQFNKNINSFATYSTGFKPVGVNLGGLPTVGGDPLIELATVKPEYVEHFELGFKTTPSAQSILNFVIYNTTIQDYQTNVLSPQLGVNRGYLANAEKVRVRGAEVDGNLKLTKQLSFYGSLAYIDGIYDSFENAPVPLEETGAASPFKDISGGDLPGISKWTTSIGGEFTNPVKVLGQAGDFFFAIDTYYRSSFSSSPSPSAYLNVDGYFLVNPRIGFRTAKGISVIVWGRNIFNQDYFEQLLPAGGSAGHYAGVLGDPRTYGITLRYSL